MFKKLTTFILSSLLIFFSTLVVYFFVNDLFKTLLLRHYDYYDFNGTSFFSIFAPVLIIFVTLAITAIFLLNLRTFEKIRNLIFLSYIPLIVAFIALGIKFNEESLENVAYTTSLSQFQHTYMRPALLSKEDDNLIVNHPDYLVFLTYLNNPLLTDSVKHSYLNDLKNIANQLDNLSNSKDKYSVSLDTFIFSESEQWKTFLMTYSNIQDPELKNMFVSITKESTIRLFDYIKFNELYIKKFIDKNTIPKEPTEIKHDDSHDSPLQSIVTLEGVNHVN